MDGLLLALTLVAALGCGLVAGVFLAFSGFVMKALARLPAPQGIAAMQAINVTAVTFAFMLALFGTAVLCLALTGWGIADWDEPYGPYLVAGGALYLIGVVGMTIGFHVPRNDALAAVEPAGADAARHWNRYVAQWTAGNHVRVAAGLAAAAAFIGAIHVG